MFKFILAQAAFIQQVTQLHNLFRVWPTVDYIIDSRPIHATVFHTCMTHPANADCIPCIMDYIFGIFILHNRPHITYKTLKDKMGLTWKVHAYGTSRRGSYTRCGVHYNKPYPGITYSIEYASTKEECTLDSKSCLDYKYNMNGCSQVITRVGFNCTAATQGVHYALHPS